MNPEDIVYLPANSSALINLLLAVSQADVDGKSLRLYVQDGTLSIKVGGGMWTLPFTVYNETNHIEAAL